MPLDDNPPAHDRHQDPASHPFHLDMFERAPVSLWLEDFSRLKTLFDLWRAAGVTDLRGWLTVEPDRVVECMNCLRVVQVNQRTLQLFEARDMAHLVAHFGEIVRDATLGQHISELQQMWEGHAHIVSRTVNYTLGGKRLDIEFEATVLPGHEATWDRVLLAMNDVTERVSAQRQLAASEAYARGLFEHSPVSLWVEDFSGVKRLLDGVRAVGITDFRAFLNVHPDFVLQCMQEIRVIDVNRETLSMLAATDKAELLQSIDDVFRDDMRFHFAEQLVDLWQNKLMQQREVVNYALDGEKVHTYMQFSVLPGHEAEWGLVLVSLTDITARKKAEAYLEYLGRHDVLTKLRNRAYYVEELNRLERKGPFPITVIAADLNGLKATNDQLGHAAGDALLARVGEVLGKVVDKPMSAARIGGDEFTVLLPGTDARGGEKVVERILALLELNNQFHADAPISLSLGQATCVAGERLEASVQRADASMYEAKRAYYEARLHDRRTGPWSA